ncbi:hypothetical protein [Profundibacter sp.]|uniref:hypothetical protein n=1 Tax=Profundibacter sp. TaxID=3101071 RepID=UPI003D0E8102
MSESQDEYTRVGQQITGAEQSQMFGKPCFKTGGKAFVAYFQDAMVFKLTGDAHTRALALEGAQLFDPSGKGRAMKEWVQVPFAHKDLWPELASAARDYVGD